MIDHVKDMHDAGARIIIFTVRGDKDLVADWLDDHDVPYDHINENPDQPEDASGKILADAYLDDRAFSARDEDVEESARRNKSLLMRHGQDDDEEYEETKGEVPTMIVIKRTVTHCRIKPEELIHAIRGDDS